VRVYLLRGLRLEGQQGLAAAISWIAERLTCSVASAVLSVSSSLRDEVSRRRIVAQDKVVVLGQGSSKGVDPQKFHPVPESERRVARRALGFDDSDLVVGFVGRLTADKGIGCLVRAIELLRDHHPHSKLLIVGEADEASPLQVHETHILSKPWVFRLPYVDDLPAAYQAMDVFCLPSIREGFPNVSLEAAASGVPVVTTFATGCRDSVIDGETGLLVPSHDPVALGEALNQLLASAALRRTMGERGRKWATSQFDQSLVWGAVAEWLATQMHVSARLAPVEVQPD